MKNCKTCRWSGFYGNRLVCWIASDDEVCTVSEDYNCEDYDERKDEHMTKKQSAQVKASIKYNKNNVKQVKMNLNRNTDADIIEYLEKADNVQGLIKDLIRKDLNDEHQAPAITKKIVSGSWQDGEFVVVEIDGKEFKRKVYYSNKHKDEVIIIYGNEYKKTEFQ